MSVVAVDEVNRMIREGFPSAWEDGARCESLADGEAVVRQLYRPEGNRPGGYIPGPTQFAVADLALWCAVFTRIGLEPMSVTSDLHIHFLRPAVGGDLMARCKILRVGKSRIHGTVDVWIDGDPDRLVAHAVGAYSNPTS